jgi:hypothetical protein
MLPGTGVAGFAVRLGEALRSDRELIEPSLRQEPRHLIDIPAAGTT